MKIKPGTKVRWPLYNIELTVTKIVPEPHRDRYEFFLSNGTSVHMTGLTLHEAGLL